MEAENKVVSIDNRRPHIALTDMDGVSRTIPLDTLRRVRDGRLKPDSIDGWDRIAPVIVGDWLWFVELEAPND